MIYDKHGNKLEDATIVPDGGRLVVKHGDSIRVPVLLMDAAPDVVAITRKALADAERPQAMMHKPGTIALSDAANDARERARTDRKAKLSDRWRDPPRVGAAQFEKPAPMNDADTRYAQRLSKLEGRWRA